MRMTTCCGWGGLYWCLFVQQLYAEPFWRQVSVGQEHEVVSDRLGREGLIYAVTWYRCARSGPACRINLRKRILMFCGGAASRPALVGERGVVAGGRAASGDREVLLPMPECIRRHLGGFGIGFLAPVVFRLASSRWRKYSFFPQMVNQSTTFVSLFGKLSWCTVVHLGEKIFAWTLEGFSFRCLTRVVGSGVGDLEELADFSNL